MFISSMYEFTRDELSREFGILFISRQLKGIELTSMLVESFLICKKEVRILGSI